jgi:hypothetical protein
MQAIAAGANEDELPEADFPPISREDVERIVKGGIRGGARETACTFVRWGESITQPGATAAWCSSYILRMLHGYRAGD